MQEGQDEPRSTFTACFLFEGLILNLYRCNDNSLNLISYGPDAEST